MIELIVINDRNPGRRFQSDAAPVRLGRRVDLEVSLPDPGVWDLHAEIGLNPEGWFCLRGLGQALVTVNQHTVQEHRLRSGDVLGIGSVKLQFTLRNSWQRSLKARELGVWMLILTVVILALTLLIVIAAS